MVHLMTLSAADCTISE